MAVDKITVQYEADIKKLQADLDKVEAELRGVEGVAKKSGKEVEDSFNKSAKSVNTFNAGLKTLIPVISAAFAVDKIIAFGTAIITSTMKFDKSLSSLSSLTGATGKDLQFFSDQAKEIGRSTTIGAEEAVKAFELIGSAKPELLASKEALAQVTKEAIALAEASGLDLPTAAQALVGALNQFALPAEEAARIINVLAAGSLAGAAAIPQIAEALDKFGTVANDANISVEESVALIETLADKNIKGAEAGTQLRNIILKLQAANIGYVDGVFNLTKALEEVKNKNLSAAEASKLFGLESITAGNILVNNVGRFKELSKAVTGTQIAYDQAKVNTANLDAQLKKLANAAEVAELEIGNKLTPALAFAVEVAGDLLSAFAGTSKESNLFTKTIEILKFQVSLLIAPIKGLFDVLGSLFTDILKPIGDFIGAIFNPIIESFQKVFGGAGDSIFNFIAKFNPLIVSLKIALLPLRLLAEGLKLLTPIITDFIIPVFEKFTIILAKARNGVAGFVNAITESGISKKIQSTLGFEIGKVGITNIEELTESFKKSTKEQVKNIDELDKKKQDSTDKAKAGQKELTEFEIAMAAERKKIHEKEIQDRIKSILSFEKMQKDAKVSGVTIDPVFDVKKTKEDAKKVQSERVKAMLARNKAFEDANKSDLDAANEHDKEEAKNEDEKKKDRENNQKLAIDTVIEATNMITDAIGAGQQRRTDEELLQNETRTNNELAELDRKKAKGQITEEQYQQRKNVILADSKKKEADIKTKDAQNDKKLALFRIAIDTAAAIIKGIVQFGPPPSPPGIAAIASAIALGAIEAGIVLATPIPKFAKGVTRFKGKGSNTSDSNLAMLSNNESVINAKASIENEKAIDALNRGDFRKYIQRNHILPALKQANESKRKEEMNFSNNMNNMVKIMKSKDGFNDYNLVRAIKKNNSVGLNEGSIEQIVKGISKANLEKARG